MKIKKGNKGGQVGTGARSNPEGCEPCYYLLEAAVIDEAQRAVLHAECAKTKKLKNQKKAGGGRPYGPPWGLTGPWAHGRAGLRGPGGPVSLFPHRRAFIEKNKEDSTPLYSRRARGAQ